eukprot:1174117-Pyramimonas_sp.AAC.1
MEGTEPRPRRGMGGPGGPRVPGRGPEDSRTGPEAARTGSRPPQTPRELSTTRQHGFKKSQGPPTTLKE